MASGASLVPPTVFHSCLNTSPAINPPAAPSARPIGR